MIFRFNNPYWLLAFLILAILFYLRTRKTPPAYNYSSVTPLHLNTQSLKHRLFFLPTLCRYLALACLIIALARPQAGFEMERKSTAGIAIEVAIDRSGSMREQLLYKDEIVNRLDIVKAVFEEFALGSEELKLKGRNDDLIGIVSFAGRAKTVCPLTLAHNAIPAILKNIKLAQTEDEDGTAIGDAIALSAARLKKAEESLEKQGDETKYKIKSKIIILLTDGQNNKGNISPFDAAKLAAEWGIKIYTVGVGGRLPRQKQDFFSSLMMPLGSAVDAPALNQISKITGAKFFMADDAETLEEIYKEIDQLEKSEFKATQSAHYNELFMNWCLASLILLLLEIFFKTTFFRRLP